MSEKITYINPEGETKILVVKDLIGEGSSASVYKTLLDGFGVVALKMVKLKRENEKLIENDLKIRREFGDVEDPHFILVRRVILHNSRRNSKLALDFPDFIGFSHDIDEMIAGCIYKCADNVDLFEMLSISAEKYPDKLNKLKT